RAMWDPIPGGRNPKPPTGGAAACPRREAGRGHVSHVADQPGRARLRPRRQCARSPTRGAWYPFRVAEAREEFEPEPWGEDAKLVETLGERGAEGFRALLGGFPEPV